MPIRKNAQCATQINLLGQLGHVSFKLFSRASISFINIGQICKKAAGSKNPEKQATCLSCGKPRGAAQAPPVSIPQLQKVFDRFGDEG